MPRLMRILPAILLIACASLAVGLSAIEPARAEPVPAADLVVIEKAERTLSVYSQGELVHRIDRLQFGGEPQGHKRFEGDQRTPEGRYSIDFGNPQSRFFLSLHISYPNAADRAFAQGQGRSPGGDIFIHGQPNGLPDHQRVAGDWTDGCIALTNAEMELLWNLVPDGTVIEIRP